MKEINLAEVEQVAHILAKKMMMWNEPIPDFGTRYPNILESCLQTPFQKFAKRNLYKGLLGKASILFYLMIKNHPFQNGNKRIAMTTVFYFLYKNDKWILVSNQQLYNFSKWVAESSPDVRNETIAAIEKFLKKYLVEVKKE